MLNIPFKGISKLVYCLIFLLCFIVLSFLQKSLSNIDTAILPSCNFSPFRDSIEFGNKQLCISEELDSPNMRAEAYLNLARAHERLGALDRALDYARHRFEPFPFVIPPM